MQAAFFDLDKTVIAKASMVAFGGSFYREGLISRGLVLRALWGQLVYMHLGASEEKLARMRESVLALTKGWDQNHVRRIVEEALEAVVEPIIYAEAADLIERHRADGHLVVIVSASPEEIVVPLGRFLGVDHVIASTAEVDDEGRYTGDMAFYAYGPYKADAMRAFAEERDIDLAASYAYSDSATDLPMLEVVGHPVVVNPDRVLARFAREHNWEVRQFVRPVRLRDRMSAPPPGPTAAGALAVGAAVGAFAWWRIRQVERAAAAAREAELRAAAEAAGWRYSVRSFFAATAPRATRMIRSRSFFIGRPR
ncbi:MAG TPA: HAD-IB family hydrolase [Acidimicrobiales bacterium]|nr:HAD-IB family hydrolase [Acidimicrobiales bacterium]